MAKKLHMEDIDVAGILNSVRPMNNLLTEIPSVENTTNTADTDTRNRRTVPEIDEAKCLAFIKENPISKQLEAKRQAESQQSASSGQADIQSTVSGQTLQSEASTQGEQTKSTIQRSSTIQNRISEKQKKEALERYRRTFLQVPKIEDRKPVFVSRKIRDKLDEIVRKLGGRKMSVSGLIENLARHHLECYGLDIEQWRKL